MRVSHLSGWQQRQNAFGAILSAAALSWKTIKILSILRRILSASFSFSPCFGGFSLSSLPTVISCPVLALLPIVHDCGRVLVQEEKRADPSLGTQAWNPPFSVEAGAKKGRHPRRHRQRSRAAWDAGLINPNRILQYCID